MPAFMDKREVLQCTCLPWNKSSDRLEALDTEGQGMEKLRTGSCLEALSVADTEKKLLIQGGSCLGRPWSSELDLLRPGASYEQKPRTGLLMNQPLGVPSKRQGEMPPSCPPGRACPLLLPP